MLDERGLDLGRFRGNAGSSRTLACVCRELLSAFAWARSRPCSDTPCTPRVSLVSAYRPCFTRARIPDCFELGKVDGLAPEACERRIRGAAGYAAILYLSSATEKCASFRSRKVHHVGSGRR